MLWSTTGTPGSFLGGTGARADHHGDGAGEVPSWAHVGSWHSHTLGGCRYMRDHHITQKAESVFWGWVAAESTQGWRQSTEGRPQRGVGEVLLEWRV